MRTVKRRQYHSVELKKKVTIHILRTSFACLVRFGCFAAYAGELETKMGTAVPPGGPLTRLLSVMTHVKGAAGRADRIESKVSFVCLSKCTYEASSKIDAKISSC